MERKPEWLKIAFQRVSNILKNEELVETRHLHTICVSGKCPYKAECWETEQLPYDFGRNLHEIGKFCATITGRPHP
jgi:lipoic acid synthetase